MNYYDLKKGDVITFMPDENSDEVNDGKITAILKSKNRIQYEVVVTDADGRTETFIVDPHDILGAY